MFDDTYNFMALKLRRYDIQAAWYTLALLINVLTLVKVLILSNSLSL
jgi:hypothetical protein